MKLSSFALRLFLCLAFAFWSVNVLAVAVFAVSDRYDGIEAIFMSLVVLIGGFAPVVVLFYLFRDQLKPQARVTPDAEAGWRRILLSAPSQPATLPSPVETISGRELEVLSLVARGFSNKEIATHLSVTVGTVKTHTNNINRKLGTRTRTEAIARARDHGLI